jgi:hypothetical protein
MDGFVLVDAILTIKEAPEHLLQLQPALRNKNGTDSWCCPPKDQAVVLVKLAVTSAHASFPTGIRSVQPKRVAV